MKNEPNLPPVQIPRRKVPIESKEAIDKAIDWLVEMDVITKVIEPTSWISASTWPRKPDGKRFDSYILGCEAVIVEQPQTLRDDTAERPCQCPQETTVNALRTSKVHHHQIQTREGNAAGRCSEPLSC